MEQTVKSESSPSFDQGGAGERDDEFIYCQGSGCGDIIGKEGEVEPNILVMNPSVNLSSLPETVANVTWHRLRRYEMGESTDEEPVETEPEPRKYYDEETIHQHVRAATTLNTLHNPDDHRNTPEISGDEVLKLCDQCALDHGVDLNSEVDPRFDIVSEEQEAPQDFVDVGELISTTLILYAGGIGFLAGVITTILLLVTV